MSPRCELCRTITQLGSGRGEKLPGNECGKITKGSSGRYNWKTHSWETPSPDVRCEGTVRLTKEEELPWGEITRARNLKKLKREKKIAKRERDRVRASKRSQENSSGKGRKRR